MCGNTWKEKVKKSQQMLRQQLWGIPLVTVNNSWEMSRAGIWEKMSQWHWEKGHAILKVSFKTHT